MDKTTLRNTVRQALATMTDEDYHHQSLAVLKKVLQEPYIIEAKNNWHDYFKYARSRHNSFN
ncbi:hypothetical protein [Lysinibacillus boronitolerans]|uniref:hypothetical protein n=1 Tax=Lysinibacillus boronitolerans TaxID=309788 RepID=UPI0002FAAC1D|nr:hypothetical protein [Lysinibacillus boronitolerans]